MDLLSAFTEDWFDLEPVKLPKKEDEISKLETAKKGLEQTLTEILLSNNLIVLCGLGSSLSTKTKSGKVTAPSMKDLWDKARNIDPTKFDQVKKKVKYDAKKGEENIENFLSQAQLFQTLNGDADVEGLIKEIEKIIVSNCCFVNDDLDLSMHEVFIRRVARRSTRLPRMQLFTTNYDTCFETAARRARFMITDGFSHTYPQEFDGSYFNYDFVRRDNNREIPDFIPNVFHLYKIHGSIDWEMKDGKIVKNESSSKPLIIYPRHSKYELSYDQPFIEMMSRFQIALRQPNTGLLVIGFGFNDRHISQPLISAIRSNVNLKAVIVSPDLKGSKKENILEINKLIKAGDSRISLLATRFEEVVKLLPDLIAPTEEEEHFQRINSTRK